MKRTFFLFGTLFVLAGLAFAASKALNKEAPDRPITFYHTNLICGAAPDIGCGTRSKPILKDFQNTEGVESAWLNHAGTIIAVKWKESVTGQAAIAKKVFAKHGRNFEDLTGEDYSAQLSDFENGNWYRGNDVDKLSIIEAGRMAEAFMKRLDGKGVDVPAEVAPALKDEVETYCREALLAIEDASVIDNMEYWRKWEADLAAIGEKHLGAGKMSDMKMYTDPKECKKDKTTCKPDKKKSSGKKDQSL